MFRSRRLLPRMARLRAHAGSGRCGYVKYSRTRRYLPERLRAGAMPSNAVQNCPYAANLDQCWQHFVDHYERFTDLLCAAARNGCEARYECEFESVRRWFALHYKDVAPIVRPYLLSEFGFDQSQLDMASLMEYRGQPCEIDMLERVFSSSTLDEVLHLDSGDLIPNIARVSDAVYRCHEAWKSGQARAN
jgi:hypothetical protein